MKKIIALVLSAVMLVSISSCGKKETVNVQFRTEGFATPEEVIDAYWEAFSENDAEKIVSLCSEEEYKLLCKQYKMDEDDQLVEIVNAVKNDLTDTYETYKSFDSDLWEINYGNGKMDLTDDYITNGYEEIGIKTAYVFSGVALEIPEMEQTLIFMDSNIPVIELENGWYYSMA